MLRQQLPGLPGGPDLDLGGVADGLVGEALGAGGGLGREHHVPTKDLELKRRTAAEQLLWRLVPR
jgi:hypothetical protein